MNNFRMLRMISMIAIFIAYRYSQPSSPPLDPPHRYSVLNDFLSPKQHQKMMKMFEELGEFPAAKQDWTSTKWVSIDEDYDTDSDGQCSKPYTMLNQDTGKCQFPNRIDIAKHFIETGGYNGWKESYQKMIYRLNPFINYQFDAYKRPEFIELFEADEFQSAVQHICGRQNPYFRPFQLSMILNLPGQSVPQHLDIPYFWTATRYAFPQWLLLVMQDSGLFKQQRLPQVQALVYVHDWQLDDPSTESYSKFGGEFILYPQGTQYKPEVVPAAPRTAVFCDGSEQVHGTSTFKPEEKPYPFDKDQTNSMKFDKKNNVWRLYINDKPTSTVYSWQDIRASIAYRGWCFSDKEIMESWNAEEWSGDLTLDDIMDILKRDLIYEKKAITVDKWNRMDEYERGLFLLDQYIQLPKPSLSRISFNYCLVFEKFPNWGIIKLIENIVC